MRIGVLSDTHGLLRPAVLDRFRGVERILHAGDVGRASVLETLGALAPVTAVHGNVDPPTLRGLLPPVAHLTVEGRLIVITHGHQFGTPTPEAVARAFPDAEVVVFGHTHRAVVARPGNGPLALNPGSAGPWTRGVAPTVAILEVPPGARPVAARIEEVGA